MVSRGWEAGVKAPDREAARKARPSMRSRSDVNYFFSLLARKLLVRCAGSVKGAVSCGEANP